MTVSYPEALVAIAVSLSILLAGAAPNAWQWLVAALITACSRRPGAHIAITDALRSQGWLLRDCQLRTSQLFPLPLQKGVVA
jgi:hypothetical protein